MKTESDSDTSVKFDNPEPVTLVSVAAAVARALAEKPTQVPELTPDDMQRLARKVYELLREDLRTSRDRSAFYPF